MSEHSRGPNYNSGSDGAMVKHSSTHGHTMSMDLENPVKVFKSDCSHTRSTVEAALIHVAPTVECNTATSSTRSDDLVAPVICRSTNFNWKVLSKCLPHIDNRLIPKFRRHLFRGQEIVRPPASLMSPQVEPIAHRTRGRELPVPPTDPPNNL